VTLYHRDVRLTETLAKASRANRRATSKSLGGFVEFAEDLLNVQHTLVVHHNWMLMTFIKLNASHAVDLIAAIVHKNFFLLHVALDQSSQGMFGPARVLLRPAFEGLLLAKGCAVTGETSLLDQWTAGDQVNVSTSVLNRLTAPDNRAMKDFWRVLCQYAHATVYSMQGGEKFNHDQVEETLGLVILLLTMNGHLIKQHLISRSMSYYATRYGEPDLVQKEQRRLRLLIDKAAPIFSSEGRAVLKSYRAKWTMAA
jgi:hypothetical protein